MKTKLIDNTTILLTDNEELILNYWIARFIEIQNGISQNFIDEVIKKYSKTVINYSIEYFDKYYIGITNIVVEENSDKIPDFQSFIKYTGFVKSISEGISFKAALGTSATYKTFINRIKSYIAIIYSERKLDNALFKINFNLNYQKDDSFKTSSPVIEYYICYFLKDRQNILLNDDDVQIYSKEISNKLGISTFGISILEIKDTSKKSKPNEIECESSLTVIDNPNNFEEILLSGKVIKNNNIWSYRFTGGKEKSFLITLGVINKDSCEEKSGLLMGSYSSIRDTSKIPLAGIMVCQKFSNKLSLNIAKEIIIEILKDEQVNSESNIKCKDSLSYFTEFYQREKEKQIHVSNFRTLRNFLLNSNVSLPRLSEKIKSINHLPNYTAASHIKSYAGFYIGLHLRSTKSHQPTFETVLLTIFSDGLARIDRSYTSSGTNAGYYKPSTNGNTIIGEFDYLIEDGYSRFKHVLSPVTVDKNILAGISLGKSIENFPSSNRIWFIKVESVIDIIRKLKYLYLIQQNPEQIEKIGIVYNVYKDARISEVEIREIRKLLIEFDFEDFKNKVIESYSNEKFFYDFIETKKSVFENILDSSGKIFGEIKPFQNSKLMDMINFFTDRNGQNFSKYSDGAKWANFALQLFS